MSSLPTLSPVPRRALSRISAYDFAWTARFHSIDALTGQVGAGTFATANNLIGTDATTLAALTGQPRWQMQDLEAGVSGRETSTLLLGASDTLVWDQPFGSGAATMLLEFVQPSSFPASGKGLLYLGNDDVSGGRWYIDSTGSQYRVTHHNGTTSVTSTLAGTAPTSGQYVRLRATRAADGVVQIHQSINFATTETSATASSALAVAVFGETTRLRVNGIGTANPTAFAAVRAVLHLNTVTLYDLVNRY